MSLDPAPPLSHPPSALRFQAPPSGATANQIAAIPRLELPLLPAGFVPAGSDVPRPAAAGFKLPEAALAPKLRLGRLERHALPQVLASCREGTAEGGKGLPGPAAPGQGRDAREAGS